MDVRGEVLLQKEQLTEVRRDDCRTLKELPVTENTLKAKLPTESLSSDKDQLSSNALCAVEDGNQDIENSAKIDKQVKKVVKPTLSVDEKLAHLKKLIAISTAYADYISKNVVKKCRQVECKQTSTIVKNVATSSNQGRASSSGIGRTTRSLKNVKVNFVPLDESRMQESPEKFDPPSSIFKGTLKEYQRDGCQWLKNLLENGANGILADEMGLGKTVQTIAMIAHLMDKDLKGPFLVIAPLSTLPHWVSEFKRFCPKVPVLLFHGDAVERNKMIKLFKMRRMQLSSREIKEVYPVVITSYDTVMRVTSFISSYNWLYLVVDEGHRLKNKDAKLTSFLCGIQSSHRLLLTGTPLQNNLDELCSLLKFLTPEIFGNVQDFKLLLCHEEMQSDAVLEQEVKEGIVSKLHMVLQPFILRRMKKDVNLILPPKKEVLVYAPMSKVQWELYNSTMNGSICPYLGLAKDDDINEIPAKRKCTRYVKYVFPSKDYDSDDEFFDAYDLTYGSTLKEKFGSKIVNKDGNRYWVNVKIQAPHIQLRKLCNHPYLVQMPLDHHDQLLVNEDLIRKSGKMMILDVLLPRLKAEGHKVLLFSTMTQILNLIEEYAVYRKYVYTRLDGSVKLEDRISEINKFMGDNEVFLFLISTRAGSLGLNLTSADTVIIFDSDWNPQVDLQAQDRCHRIGQTKPVVVYRFVTKATIDEKIVEYSQNKRKLEKLVLHNDCFKGFNVPKKENSVSVEELKALLSSSDYSKIVNTTGKVLSEKEIQEILDRSDMGFTKKF